MIQINHLTKTYGKARGITELTLHVPENVCFGFIGPNGAGKSTLFNAICGDFRYRGFCGKRCFKGGKQSLSPYGDRRGTGRRF